MTRKVVLFLSAALMVSVPALSQVRDYAYIAVPDQNAVSVFDTVALSFVTSIPVGSGPEGVVFGPDRTRVYVLSPRSSDIPVINTGIPSAMYSVSLLGKCVAYNGWKCG